MPALHKRATLDEEEAQNEPGGQIEHAEAPVEENEPMGHSRGTEAPGKQ